MLGKGYFGEDTMYPQAYLDYLIHFHATRDYFECHEVLEEYWKEEGQQNHYWVGLIQLAVGLYHQRRQNYAGAEKMLLSSQRILKVHELELAKLGLKPKPLLQLIGELITAVQQNLPYQSVSLPLEEELKHKCEKRCQEEGLIWCAQSDLTDQALIDRHKLRDRTEVIQERAEQLQLKQQARKAK